MNGSDSPSPEFYQGQFGPFTITPADRQGVIFYRVALAIMAACFALATVAVLWPGHQPIVLQALTPLYLLFCLAMGLSLALIHIYMSVLHRFLQLCWGIGCVASLVLLLRYPQPLAESVYHRPLTLLGVGFIFVALNGIFFKEAFCFNRLETKLLTPLLPILLIGHLLGILSLQVEQVLLANWAILFVIFAARKWMQPIPADIGDKSVFAYLHGEIIPNTEPSTRA
jgi:uncharacterized integral membrane protein